MPWLAPGIGGGSPLGIRSDRLLCSNEKIASPCTMSPCMTSKWAKRSGAFYVDCGMARQRGQDCRIAVQGAARRCRQ